MEDAKSAARNGWDAIVIGSGLGGLTCAAYLCAAGKRTLVLERTTSRAGTRRRSAPRARPGLRVRRRRALHRRVRAGRRDHAHPRRPRPGRARRVPAARPGRLLDPGLPGLHVPRAGELGPLPDAPARDLSRREAEPLGRVVDVLREVGEQGRRLQTAGDRARGPRAAAPELRCSWGLRPVTELFAEHGISQQAPAVLLGEQGDYAVRPSKTPDRARGGPHRPLHERRVLPGGRRPGDGRAAGRGDPRLRRRGAHARRGLAHRASRTGARRASSSRRAASASTRRSSSRTRT